MIYMDNAATTKQTDRVLSEMDSVYRCLWENPSGVYKSARGASERLEIYRRKIADCLNCETSEIYFTSGGTESDNWGILNLAHNGEKVGKKHCVVSAIEHHAVLNTLKCLTNDGWKVTYVYPSHSGVISPSAVKRAIRPDTAFVCVMYANNETGAVQPVRDISKVCAEYGVPFFCDAVQAVGHLPVDFRRDGIDVMSLSAHKFHGPLGVGALIVRDGVALSSMIVGGMQENMKRAGTENLPGVAGMAIALSDSVSNMVEAAGKTVYLRDKLVWGILTAIPGTHLAGPDLNEHRLPGIANIMFDCTKNTALLARLDEIGVCASAGSACDSASVKPSHVLTAMSYSDSDAHTAIRFSLSEQNTEQEIEIVLEKLPGIVRELRGIIS